tara:strand:- start:2824 stop:3687 length:864 start_codon:yes stop_codon:yes gene_type:complete
MENKHEHPIKFPKSATMNAERFYVYEHIRKDTGAVFYVGKGSGKRCNHFANRGKFWNNFCKSKQNVEVRLPIKNVDEEFSLLAEVELIDLYRRRGVRLVNISDGGEGTSGWIPSDKTRQRIGEANKHTPKASGEKHGMFGKKHTPESLAKMVASQNKRDHTNHPMRGKQHTNEAKAKVSLARKGKCVGKDNPFYGKTHSPEALEKMRLASIGRKASEQTRKHMSIAALTNAPTNKLSKPVLCLTNGVKYYGLNEASKQLNLHRQTIRMVCNGKLKQTGGYVFQWSEK